MGGARGEVRLRQRAPHAPTWATFELSAAAADDYEAELRFASSVRHYGIRELPPLPGAAAPCNHTGGLYNPSGVDLASVPPPGRCAPLLVIHPTLYIIYRCGSLLRQRSK